MKWFPAIMVALFFVLATFANAGNGTKVRFMPRTGITEVALASAGSQISVSFSAGVSDREATFDVFIWNTSSDTTEAYWKFKSALEASAAADGATLTAATGMILIQDVPRFAILDWSGANGIMTIWSKGDR